MRYVLTLIAVDSLAGCDRGADTAAPERRNAAGEVLGGEISDAMLPLDTVRSTSPVDRPTGSVDPNGASGTARSGADAEADSETVSTPSTDDGPDGTSTTPGDAANEPEPE